MADRVDVSCRHGTYPGLRSGRVCTYDFQIPEQYEVQANERTQRVFVLLDEHIQLCQPLTFPEAQRDWWYVDLVEVDEGERLITVKDHWIDVVVPPPGQPYRVMDCDELADAIDDGRITPGQVVNGLKRVQQFLDTYLHGPRGDRGLDAMATSWNDFPPSSLAPVRTIQI